MLDEEFGEGSGDSTQGLPPDRVLVEVRDADSPALNVLPDREVVAPGGTQPDLAKRLAVRTRGRYGVTELCLGEADGL